MATIGDYQSGKAGKAVKRSVDMMRSIDGPLPDGDEFRIKLTAYTAQSEPKKIDLAEAKLLIDKSNVCAVGDRICFCEYQDVPHTYSVFLDELAIALDAVKKAKIVSKEKAIELIGQHANHPIIISKVNGKYMEICRTLARSCLYWNMEKKGIKCIAGVDR